MTTSTDPEPPTEVAAQHPRGRTTPLSVLLVFAMALPMLVLYAIGTVGPFLRDDLGLSLSALGTLTAACFAVSAVLSLWAGPAVERIGVRPALVGLFLVVAAAFSVVAASTAVAGLVAAVGVCGIAQALANPVTNKLIAHRIPAERRAAVVGLKQAGVQMAALAAGLLLPVLVGWLGWRTALALVAPVALLCAAAALLLLPPLPRPGRTARASHRPGAALRWLMAFQWCLGASLAAFTTFLPTFAHTEVGVSVTHAGLLMAGFGIAGIVSRVRLTPVADRMADQTPLLAGLSVAASGAILATWASGATGWAALSWLGALGVGATAVAANAVSMAMVVRDRVFGPVASASGLVSLAFFAGFAVSPPLVGAAADSAAGFAAGWLLIVGVLLAGACCAVVLGRVLRRPAPGGAGKGRE